MKLKTYFSPKIGPGILTKKLTAAFMTLMLAFSGFPHTAFAGTKNSANKKVGKVTPSPIKHIVINPVTIRQILLEGNISVLLGTNKVYMAKHSVDSARANLLPKLNMAGAFNGTAFSLTTVAFLLPFLLPSNWFDLSKINFLLAAEKDSYYLLELNVYASALGLYQTYVNDLSIRQVLLENYEVLEKFYEILNERGRLGKADTQDIARARVAANKAQYDLQNIEIALATELAEIKKALSLDLTNRNIEVQPLHMEPSPSENQNPVVLLNQAIAIAPEMSQIRHLISATESGKWSAIFAFLNAGAVSSIAGASGSASFNNAKLTDGVSLSAGTFPAVALSNDNIRELRLRQQELRLEQSRIIETTVGNLSLVQKEIEIGTENIAKSKEIFEVEYQRYMIGKSDILLLLTAQSNVLTSSLDLIRAQILLDSLRISIHRLVLTGQFSKISGCQFNPKNVPTGFNKYFGWVKEIFSPKASIISIDKACRSTFN